MSLTDSQKLPDQVQRAFHECCMQEKREEIECSLVTTVLRAKLKRVSRT